MIRKIIKIDENKCNGCGLCANACHEGAIGIIGGKAKLLRDDYCDGLGDCLPVCPTKAITFEEREAAAYDDAAVNAHISQQAKMPAAGCPGFKSHEIKAEPENPASTCFSNGHSVPGRLSQWPVQIKLAPVNAPYFENANLLIAADCTAFAYGNFHEEFIKNKITLIGCPKLDDVDYSEKLTDILKHNNIKSITVARMEVPCCGGIENAVKTALKNCGKIIPWQAITISINGHILED